MITKNFYRLVLLALLMLVLISLFTALAAANNVPVSGMSDVWVK